MSIKIKLFIIFVFAFFIRAINIGSFPALNPDEAALGYNAYSLLITGKDEHGLSWPLHFKSFGDYKPGGYIYLALPFIKTLGLTPLAIRLPNLIFSILTLYFLYRLIFILTKQSQLALLSTTVLALSPWHIHFSRGAWESNTALFFIILSIYWFYSYLISKKNYFLYFFPLPAVASLYIYHSARLIVPVLFFIFILSNLKKFLNRSAFTAFFIAILMSLPVAFSFFQNGGTTRFSGVGILADSGPLSRSEELLNQHSDFNLYDRLIHNRRVLYTISWAEKYFSHLDLNFLFLNGDEVPRSRSPDMGQLYLFELPFLILGFVYLLKNKNFKTLRLFSLIFLFVSPLASSLTFQAPSALRSLPMVIPLSIVVSVGIYFCLKSIHRVMFNVLIIILYLFSVFYFFDAYFIHAPSRYPFAWNRGFSEIIPLIEKEKSNFQNVYVTNIYDQPYILYLFYSKYDPALLQSQINLTPPDQFGFSTVEKIDNITFYIPDTIPKSSLVFDFSDFQLTGQSFKIYIK